MPTSAWVADALRACHQLDGNDTQWLAGVASCLGHGAGAARILSCFFRAESSKIHPLEFVMQGSLPEHRDAFLQSCERVAHLARTEPGNPARDPDRLSHGVISFPSFTANGVLGNSWGLFATDAPDSGCAFVFIDTPMPPRMQQRWDSLAPHVSRGLGLRRKPSSLFERSSHNLESWIEPSTPQTGRQPVLQPVMQIDRERASPSAAHIWRGFLAGEWLLLHHFAQRGRRYVVACRTETYPGSVPLCALTHREAQVISLAAENPDYQAIACAMQSKEATVKTHLARAMKKLGVHSRAELLAIMRMMLANDAGE